MVAEPPKGMVAMTAKYSQWASIILFALMGSGILFAPVQAQASRAAESTPGVHLGVANIHFDRTAGDHLTAVHFTVTASAPANLRVRLTARGVWYACSAQGAQVVCPTQDAPAVVDVDRLEVEVR
jgi:hypothetical protein